MVWFFLELHASSWIGRGASVRFFPATANSRKEKGIPGVVTSLPGRLGRANSGAASAWHSHHARDDCATFSSRARWAELVRREYLMRALGIDFITHFQNTVERRQVPSYASTSLSKRYLTQCFASFLPFNKRRAKVTSQTSDYSKALSELFNSLGATDTARVMSFFEYAFPSSDLVSSGKLESDPFSCQTHGATDLETVDSSFYDFLGMSEKSFNLEDMMIQSKVDSVPADYLTQSDYKQRHQTFKRETYTPELDESELCLPSTITDANDYVAMMEPGAYSMEAASPAGMSTTSSASNPRQLRSKGGRSVDKDSDEYRRRRQLNNIAVKKSREKAKAESRMIAQRVTVLSADKERLERRVEMLSKEVQILHGLFAKMNNVPDTVRAELARSVARLQIQPR